MKYQVKDGTLTLYPEGRIDSTNAESVEREMRSLRSTNLASNLVLDLENLLYSSSAGLRIFLRLLKENISMKMINASSEVYDILEMTGFTEMIPIQKAYRRLSVEGCEEIARGSNGLVYRLDRDTIVKVYENSDCLQDIQRERKLARKAFVLGIPTAISYDVVRVGEGYGSVFEMLNARSLAKIIKAEPDRLDECVRLSVGLLKKIHAIELKPGEMPDKRQEALKRTAFLKDHLPPEQYRRLYDRISAIPTDCHLLHGDYHIRNIMLQDGEPLLIDMDTLSLGHPVFEFASIYMSCQGFGELDSSAVTDYLGIPYETSQKLMKKIFWEYFDIQEEETYRTLLDKARVIGYAFMMRRAIRRQNDTEYGQRFAAYCAEQLEELLSRVDSLAF